MTAPSGGIPTIGAEWLRQHVSFEDLIEPVSRAFQEFSAGLAESGVLSLFPAATPEAGDVLVKTGAIRGHSVYVIKVSPWFAVNVERNQPQGGFIGVFDAETGQTRAILNEEHYLSDIRTAAAGTLAARVLAPPVVEVAGVLGAGVQAYWQPQALYRARPFKTLLIWARDAGKAEALQARLGEKLVGVEIRVTLSAEEVVRACDVLLTTTQAKEPIVRGAWLRPGQHITAIGADDVTKSELDAACLQRADRLIVDSLELAKQQGEVHRWLERGDIALEQVHGELGQVLAGTVAGRRTASEITVAKLVGLGVQDLVAVEVALDKLTSTS